MGDGEREKERQTDKQGQRQIRERQIDRHTVRQIDKHEEKGTLMGSCTNNIGKFHLPQYKIIIELIGSMKTKKKSVRTQWRDKQKDKNHYCIKTAACT